MPAIAIAGIGAAASIGSGVMGASAAHSAAETQAAASLQATRESNQMLQRQYDTTRADQLPYLTGGAGALGRLDYLLGLPGQQASTKKAYAAGYGPMGSAPTSTASQAPQISPAMLAQQINTHSRLSQLDPWGNGAYMPQDEGLIKGYGYTGGINPNAAAAQPTNPNDPEFGSLMKDFTAADFTKDPGYEFRLSEGQKALDRSAASKGGLFSGATIKASTRYNQNAASEEFGNAYNRFQNNRTTKYNFLSNAAGGGQVAANQLGQTGSYLTGQMANNTFNGITGAGNARASGYIGAANAYGDAINGVGNAAIYGIQNYKPKPKPAGRV